MPNVAINWIMSKSTPFSGSPGLIVLGIETSCDETAAAVVDDQGGVRSDVVLSQLDEHRPYGGIVPEIAARAHLDTIDGVIRRAMDEAAIEFAALDGIAATGGPGLIGGLIVGVMTAKGIAAAHDLPFIAVNHREGHALTARLTDGVGFPYLLVLVSGGHCQILAVEAVGRYQRLGTTLDDAVGEAFDKVAKMLGLGYPGGPEIERMAALGRAGRFALPRPMLGRPGADFSFSGLKTAARHVIEALPEGALSQDDVADVCASFQDAVGDVLADRCGHAIQTFRARWPQGDTLVVAGGVAANREVRRRLEQLCRRHGMKFVAPPPGLCTDNAAMIAWAGLERLQAGDVDGLDFAPRPRGPLDPDAAPAPGAGVKA